MANVVNTNPILDADSYKVNMYRQYPEGTQYVYSYISARAKEDKPMVFFGLQEILQKLEVVLTREDVLAAAEQWRTLDPTFNVDGWLRIVEKHEGRLPLEIKAVDEGTVLATQNVVLTIVNTDPEFYWLTTWVETLLQRLWYTCTVATRSYRIRMDIEEALLKSGDVAGLDYKLHDMGSRAGSCTEHVSLGTMSHLVAFNGTDTLTGRIKATQIYGAERDIAGTIPAMEHSTVTSWGKEREFDAYMNMYDLHLRDKPEGMCSIVMDSYDLLNAIKEYSLVVGDSINTGGITVIRIDSGEPEELLSQIMNVAAKYYSYSYNSKGYRVFDKIRFIWSDGVTEESIKWILDYLIANSWSADNFAFGVGGYLMQKVNRDTLSFAMKCSAAIINDEVVRVLKNPVTASYKKSLSGFLALAKYNGDYITVEGTKDDGGLLTTVYKDGKIMKVHNFADIRKRVRE